jgi:uncharacterized membrane protein (DUF4010 family)
MVDRLAVVTTLLLAACGGAHNEAKHAEPDPWAGYKGLYATSVVAIAPRTTTAPVARTRAAAGAAPTAQAAPLPTLATNSNKGASSNVARGAKKKAKK